VSLFITGSKASGRELAARRNFNPRKIVNIYHGIQAITLPDLSVNPLRLCMISLLEERKGHRYVLQALRQLIDADPVLSAVQLVIVGDGPLRNELTELAALLKLNNNVNFEGYKTEYLELLVSSCLLLNPSTENEDLPYVIIEAMRAGVPVIGTPIAGIAEEISDGVTGVIVPAKNSDALCAAMARILTDPKLRGLMSENSKKRFSELFALDSMVRRYCALYHSQLK
ncbi:MAG: glycosyltransferase family 4 protein, partial [Elusimicrobiaceae bacterium]